MLVWGPLSPGVAQGAPDESAPPALHWFTSLACPSAPCRPRTLRAPLTLLCVSTRREGVGVLLQRTNSHVPAYPGLDGLDRGRQSLHGGDAGNTTQDGGGADLVPVQTWTGLPGAAERGVDDQIDLTGVDELNDGRFALGAGARAVLAYDLGAHTVATQHHGCALGGQDLEAEVGQALDRENHRPLVPVGDRDEHLALCGQGVVHRQLGLGVGGTELAVQTPDLTGGTHFGAENGVDPLTVLVDEPVERQHRLLDGDGGLRGQVTTITHGREHTFGTQLGDGGAGH